MFLNALESKWVSSCLFATGLVLFLLRKPLPILLQPGRVEDVDILLSQALQNGWRSIFVLYNYYFHLVPRLVTLGSLSLLGMGNVHLGMNLAAIIIATLCAVFFSGRQFRFIIKSDLLRMLCSLFVILVPGIDEVYSNISSIQWFLNIFIMLVVSMLLFRYDEFDKKSVAKKSLYGFLLSLSVLSSAFSLVLLPVLLYVIIREWKKVGRNIVTLSSYAVPLFFMIFEAATLYISYTQQYRSSSLGVTRDVLMPTANAFAISVSKIFYHDTPTLFGQVGNWMYLIPVVVIAIIIIGSIKERPKFEAYVLAIVAATLFWSSAVRGSMLDWNCLCGQAEERYFFFAVVSVFILIVRQFDKKRNKATACAFAAFLAMVSFNIASGFLMPTVADSNWNYVAQQFDASGRYHCYVGEVPHGWAVSIPCSNRDSGDSAPGLGGGPAVTFVPPIVTTNTTIFSYSRTMIFGIGGSFLATVMPTPDSGEIQFQADGTDMGTPVTLVGGKAEISNLTLTLGTHRVAALYLGGPNSYPSSSSPVTVTVLGRLNLAGADLSGSSLAGADLSGLDMNQVNMSHSNLERANLSGSDLQGADLSGATLSGAQLVGTKLEKVRMQNANLQTADLSSADLEGADLEGAILSGANLTGANLLHASVGQSNFAGAITKGCIGCP